MRTAPAAPAIGLTASAVLLAVLAATTGLATAGWVTGLACAAIVNGALAIGLIRHRTERLAPADWVTLTRATLSVWVAALVADAFVEPAPVALLVALASVALALDAVDGWIARRTRTTALGGRFDGEVDAFLILVLSVYVARFAGPWVLAIGLARYAFLLGEWTLPWMRADELPPRRWRKVVAATQGIVLTVAAANFLPLLVTRLALLVSLGLLAESFGRDAWWLFQRRAEPARPRPRWEWVPAPVRTVAGAALTLLAVVVVWGALVLPDDPTQLSPSVFLRVPLEGLIVVALALVLPAAYRRVLAWIVGPLLGLLVIVKVLGIGFRASLDRPFDPVQDVSYAGIGVETMRESIGRTEADLILAAVILGVIALLVVTTLAVVRLTRVAAGERQWSLRAVGALGAVWALCWLFGAQFVSHAPIASTSSAGLVVNQVDAVRAGLQDPEIFDREIRDDPYRSTPAARLLTGLRGKDVVLVFIESYGEVAVRDSPIAPRITALLDRWDRRLRADGFQSRTGMLTSSTFGGVSWLAHASLQAGVWVDSQRRYDQAIKTDRLTLSGAFNRAGWRSIGLIPSNNRPWPEGERFYRFDRVYDRRHVGYRGPQFGYAAMPDQYTLAALQRLELGKRDRPPLFAEVDLVSSHTPWTHIPRMVGWNQLGDGSIFNRIPVDHTPRGTLWSDPDRLRAAFGRSIEYSLTALLSFIERYGDDDLVVVVAGDHQPWTIISGDDPSHDVPVSIIARDPAVLRQVAGWGWDEGLRPGPDAPVWRMDELRNRFLEAFGSQRSEEGTP